MKTHTIKATTAELLILELPENGNTFDDLTFLNSETEGYTLLGKPDEIAENEKWDVYKPYKGSMEKETSKESLLSLLESEIYWDVNPLGKDKPNFDPFLNYGQNEHWVGLKNKWHEAESRTFDKTRTLIFKKN